MTINEYKVVKEEAKGIITQYDHQTFLECVSVGQTTLILPAHGLFNEPLGPERKL